MRIGLARLRLALLAALVLLVCLGAARIGHAAVPASTAAAASAAPSTAAPPAASGAVAGDADDSDDEAPLAFGDAGHDVSALAERAGRFVQRNAKDASLPGLTRVDVEVGRLDPRLRLAPCPLVRPYLPKGTRLWGRSHIGLRCEGGRVAWNVFLPVTVRFYARALVAGGALPAGTTLEASQLAWAEVDLAAERGNVYTQPQMLVGRRLTRPLATGQALRSTQLQPRQWFAAGDTVRITAQGGGFAVRATGEALSPGIEGRAARVRTESGRILSGLPVAERELSLSL